MRYGKKHGLWNTPGYRHWRSVVQRCVDPNVDSWRYYGGKGVTVCDRWREYANFLADMGPKPPGMQIDRIDGSKGYEPGNCRWVTPTENIRNRSNTRRLTARGETLTLTEWSERTGLGYTTIKERVRRGWSAEDALSRPVQR